MTSPKNYHIFFNWFSIILGTKIAFKCKPISDKVFETWWLLKVVRQYTTLKKKNVINNNPIAHSISIKWEFMGLLIHIFTLWTIIWIRLITMKRESSIYESLPHRALFSPNLWIEIQVIGNDQFVNWIFSSSCTYLLHLAQKEIHIIIKAVFKLYRISYLNRV